MNPLQPVPSTLVDTRLALHRLSAYVIAPVRHQATGRFGLRATPNGFGTPEFDGRRIRVEATTLIDERPDGERTAEITSLTDAAVFLDTTIDTDTAAEHDTPGAGDVDAALDVDPASSLWLGSWFAMAFDALGQVRGDDASVDASEPQLWPGHFDPAIEIGDDNHRGSYGASPGDDGIDEPYLYLSIWWPDRIAVDATDPAWNATAFTGAVLPVSAFPATEDPVEVAARFWRDARDRLA